MGRPICFTSPLPRNYPIHQLLLLGGGSPQIDSSRFYAFVTHQVGEERNVIVLIQEVLRESMAEGVRIHHFGVEAVLVRELFQLGGDPSRSDDLSETVAEDVSGSDSFSGEPFFRFFAQ